MARQFHPSEYILRKAWKLGRKMARKDHKMDLDLTFCYQYSNYDAFRVANRVRLQSKAAMLVWEERIQSLVERAVHGMHLSLDDQRTWDAIDMLVVRPIRHAFWVGWEQEMQLERLYHQVVRSYASTHRSTVLHVNPHSPSALRSFHPALNRPTPDLHPDAEEEHGLWDQVAKIIFDELGVNDGSRFWRVTGAEIECDHTGDESLDNLPRVFGPIHNEDEAMAHVPEPVHEPEPPAAVPPHSPDLTRLTELAEAQFSA